jgi:hypothetical protein
MPVPTIPVPPPATLAAGITWNSGIIQSPDAYGVVACGTLDQTGTLTVQRYIDPKGTAPVGPPIVQAMTASTAAFAGIADGLPYGSYSVAIENTSGTLGNLSKVFTRFNYP